MSTAIPIHVANSEADMVEYLHDLTMSRKGPDAVIARGCKEMLPALERFVRDELVRGTDAAEIVLCIGHVMISLHMTSLLTISGGASGLAPVLDTIMEHTQERYAEAVKRVMADARAVKP